MNVHHGPLCTFWGFAGCTEKCHEATADCCPRANEEAS